MNMNSNLICADSFEADNGRIYYVSDDNKRHWIQSPEIAASYGWDLGTTVKLPMDEIIIHPLSFSVAKNFDNTGLMQQLPYCKVQGGGYKEG